MLASVHVADVGVGQALKTLRRRPTAPGLRTAEVALAARFTHSKLPNIDVGRVALIAFWDDDDALDRFLAESPFAARLAGGWYARLDPLRAFGAWPGLPEDVPRPRTVTHDGPAVVITLGRLRLPQAPRFLRTSARAEARVVDSPGLVWATGLARPPFFSTCSVWESGDALSAYAYGSDGPAHSDAIAADRAKPFHHRSAFIRFRPYASSGGLGGRNPLAATWADSLA